MEDDHEDPIAESLKQTKKDILAEASKLRDEPGEKIPDAFLWAVMGGFFATIISLNIKQRSRVTRFFGSSTFDDTFHFREVLMKYVYPILSAICRMFGLEFSDVDMRWGVRESTGKKTVKQKKQTKTNKKNIGWNLFQGTITAPASFAWRKSNAVSRLPVELRLSLCLETDMGTRYVMIINFW